MFPARIVGARRKGQDPGLKEEGVRPGPSGRHRLLRAAICAGLAAGLLLSPRLWLGPERGFPLTPVWEGLRGLTPSSPYDLLPLALLLALLAPTALLPAKWWRWFAVPAVALCVFLALLDQQRWQPWFYQYLFMLGALVLCRSDTALNACRLVVAAIYFWSGLQKANAGFRQDVYPWLTEPFAGGVPDAYQSWLSAGAYAVPAVEAAIGLGLLARRTRPFAVAGAVLMHAFIMASIGPWGHDHNTVVWPWNLAMVAFVLVLFWRPRDAPSLAPILLPGRSSVRGAALVLFAVMPLLSFWGLWGSYLSASLYSGNLKNAFVVTQEPAGPVRTNVEVLSLEILNVPAYPEERVFESIARERCAKAAAPERISLVVHGKPGILSGGGSTEVHGCRELLGDDR